MFSDKFVLLFKRKSCKAGKEDQQPKPAQCRDEEDEHAGKEDQQPNVANEGSQASSAEQGAQAIANRQENVLSGSSVEINVEEIKNSWLKALLYLVLIIA